MNAEERAAQGGREPTRSSRSVNDGVGLGPTVAFRNLRAVVAARHPGADLDHLHAVAVMAADCHRGQHRRSGDQYVTHPFVVATYVAEWGRSLSCVKAAMLHDILDGGWYPPILRDSVDDRVITLIELLYELEEDGLDVLEGLAPDLIDDVLALKLADRLHNARTWAYVPPGKVRRKARETIEFLVPIAERIGLADVGEELARLSRLELANPRARPAPPVIGVSEVERTSSIIVGWAVNRLPPGERDRYAQEWAADLRTLPTRRERLLFQLGVMWSARRMR